MNCTCSYEESEEMTKHAPLCAISIAAKVKAEMYRHVAAVCEADANGDENLKEFWEGCTSDAERKSADALLRELATRLRAEADRL